MTNDCVSDLLIIGGGPSGLAAAINGASEGLSVRLLDNGTLLGGQARESASIENYPGFPEGVTGIDLMGRFVQQARKFDTQLHCPVAAAGVVRDGKRLVVTTDDYQEYVAKAIILSIGLSYRRLAAKNSGQFIGRGVYYGVPAGYQAPRGTNSVVVVGGANSAGQAVLNLARNKKLKVHLMIRKTIDAQMSTYLIDRIRRTDNIEVVENSEVVECFGESSLTSLCYNRNGVLMHCDCSAVFIYIGATPRTLWIRDLVELDDNKYVRTWTDVTTDKVNVPYATSVPGVYAAGDVRSGSVKRIASGIGEGVGALQMVHRYLGGL